MRKPLLIFAALAAALLMASSASARKQSHALDVGCSRGGYSIPCSVNVYQLYPGQSYYVRIASGYCSYVCHFTAPYNTTGYVDATNQYWGSRHQGFSATSGYEFVLVNF